MPSLRRIAQLAHQLDVVGAVDQLELSDGRSPRWKQVAVLDQARGSDEIDGELDADGLQRMLIRQLVLHQRVAVDQRDRARHGNLR